MGAKNCKLTPKELQQQCQTVCPAPVNSEVTEGGFHVVEIHSQTVGAVVGPMAIIICFIILCFYWKCLKGCCRSCCRHAAGVDQTGYQLAVSAPPAYNFPMSTAVAPYYSPPAAPTLPLPVHSMPASIAELQRLSENFLPSSLHRSRSRRSIAPLARSAPAPRTRSISPPVPPTHAQLRAALPAAEDVNSPVNFHST